MKALVTGASGYIGGAVVARLVAAGHEVVGLARSQQAADSVAAAGGTPYRGDVTDPDSVIAAVRDAELVVHNAVGMAGGVGESDHVFVQAMLNAAPAGSTFVLTSGVAVYAGVPGTYFDESTPLDAAIAGQQPRIALEKRVLAHDGPVRTIVLRPGHVYGCGHAGLFTRTHIAAAVGAGEGIFVTDGTSKQFAVVHIDDLADAYLSVLDTRLAEGVFNLVATMIPTNDLGTATSHAVGAAGRATGVPMATALERWGPLAHILVGLPMLSTARAEVVLDWSPHRPTLVHELTRGSLRPNAARP